MLKSMEKNKSCLLLAVTLGVFGIAGLIFIPVVLYIIKISKRYPKTFGWIIMIVLLFICIYTFLFMREWNPSFFITMICIGIVAISHILNAKDR